MSLAAERVEVEERVERKSIVAITRDEDVIKSVAQAITLLGGLSSIIREGDRVLVKPNFCLAVQQGSGVTTDVRVVEAVVREVQKAGGVAIIGEGGIGGSPVNTEKALDATGVKDVATRPGAEVVNFDRDATMRIGLQRGKALNTISLPRTVLDCNVRISVPVLKYHPECTVTLSLKNMKGCLPGEGKEDCHRRGIHQSIVDYNTVLKPHLAVIDGTVAGAWRQGQETVRLNTIIASFDPVAADAVGSFVLGVDPRAVRHLVLASEAGFGTLDLGQIEIRGEDAQLLREELLVKSSSEK